MGTAGVDGALVADALAVLGELAANAVRHARTVFTVSAVIEGGVLRLRVSDGDPRPPRLLDVGFESTGGRGLQIVSGIASRWGWEPADVNGVPGKWVWAELGATARGLTEQR